MIPVTTEAAKLPMGSSMPVFISLCAGQSGIELCLFGRSGQGREQSLWGLCPVGVSCMFCVCLRVWHCFSGPWHSANTHQCLCACIQGPCSFFLLHNLWSCICVAVGFKGQPSAGLQHIQYSGVHFRWKIFVVLAIIFSTTLIKNTAVTCPKPKCSLGLYFTLGTASLWGVCTAYSLLYYSSIFFSAKFPGGEARVSLIQLPQQQQDTAHVHLEQVLTDWENAKLGREEKMLFS